MTQQRLGIVMHGVTGRMGMNQHLIRSIVAIRDQGGVMLANGDARDARPGPDRPQRREDRSAGARARHRALRHRSRRRARRPERHRLLRRRHDADAPDAACPGAARGQARLLREADRDQPRRSGRGLPPRRRRRASSTARCRTSSSCPACASSTCCAAPASSAACSRCASTSATGSSRATCSRSSGRAGTTASEDGGGMILDMMCHWRYVLDNLFGEVQSITCLGATHIGRALGRSRPALRPRRPTTPPTPPRS